MSLSPTVVEEKRTICRQYDGRATAENYIKEGCNDAGFGVLSGQNFKANQNYLQMAILAYNSNRWLQLMALVEQESYQRRQLRTERLRLVFVAAKLVVHEGRKLGALQPELWGAGSVSTA